MTANNQSLLHQLTSDTSNTSVPSKPSTSTSSTRLSHQVSNNLPQHPSVDCLSINYNSRFATPIEAMYIPELDIIKCKQLLKTPSRHQLADKQPSIQIKKPSNTSHLTLPGTEKLQHPQETRQLTSHTSNTSLACKPTFSVLSNTQCSISTNSLSASLYELNLLQHLVKKYHIKDLTIRLSRLSDQVLEYLQQNGTVDCNVVDNQMSEQKNVRIKLESVTVDPCVCNDQVSDNLQQNGTVDCNVVDNQVSEQINVRIKLEPFDPSFCNDQVLDSLQQNGTVDCNVVDNQVSEQRNVRIKLEPFDPSVCDDQVSDNLQQNLCSTVDGDDIEVPFEAIYDPLVKCEPDLVKTEPSADLSAGRFGNHHLATFTVKQEEVGKAEPESDVQPDLPQLGSSAETSSPSSNEDVNISASVLFCAHCDFTTNCKSKITSHITNQHVKKSNYQCQQCGKGFNYNKDLHMHMSRVHLNNFPYKCLLCNRGFQHEKRYNAHVKNHDKKFLCDVCGKIVSNKHALTKHKMKIHTRRSPLSRNMCHSNLLYKCDVCDKSFELISNLRLHQLNVHAIIRAYSCNQCEKTFVSKVALKSHSVVHSDLRPFKCEKCGLCFNLKLSLTYHIRTVHSNVRAFKCHICGKSFESNCYLTKHLMRHSAVRNFKCGTSGKLFPQHMKQHLSSHSEIRPFACAQCHLKFKLQGELTVHIVKVHSDLHPFSYKSEHKLKYRHLVHNERKLQCYQCKRSFNYRHTFNAHFHAMHSNLYSANLETL